MQYLMDAVLILLGYLLGSIPSGLIIVKLKTGKASACRHRIFWLTVLK